MNLISSAARSARVLFCLLLLAIAAPAYGINRPLVAGQAHLLNLTVH